MFKREKRINFPSWFRLQIASEQQWCCNICKKQLSSVFDIDHITPLCDGGCNERYNLQCLCVECHAKKSRSERFKIRAPDPENKRVRNLSTNSCMCKCSNCGFEADSRLIGFHKCTELEIDFAKMEIK
jgi:hypothetical protein